MRMSNSNVKLFGLCIKQVTETVTIDIQHLRHKFTFRSMNEIPVSVQSSELSNRT